MTPWNSEPVWKHAKVERVTFGWEDHGFLSSYIHLTGGGWGQGFGGLILGYSGKSEHEEKAYPYLYRWVTGILNLFDVDDWSKLTGRRCWVLAEHTKAHALRSEFGKRTFWISDEAEEEFSHITEVENFWNPPTKGDTDE